MQVQLVAPAALAVLVKRYPRPVSVDAVKDLHGLQIAEGVDRGVLITTAHFSREAREYARTRPLWLIDGAALAALLEARSES